MRSIITSLLFVVGISNAATMPTWNFVSVLSSDKTVAGYIYHTYAIGTEIGKTTNKVASGLRLICSAKNSAEPLIVIYWNGWMYNAPTQYVWSAPNGKALSSDEWNQDGKLLYRSVLQSKKLIDAIKMSKTIQFTWTGVDAVRYNVIFDTTEFTSKLNDFNNSCKTEL